MEHSALCYDTVADLAARYRIGELSPVRVTEAALARIEQYNPSLHAFVRVTRGAGVG